MTIQHFATASSTVVFPQMYANGVVLSAPQLRAMHWDAASKRIVATFVDRGDDYNLPNLNYVRQLQTHLWRDGSSMDGLIGVPLATQNVSIGVQAVNNDLGQVLMPALDQGMVNAALQQQFSGTYFFRIADRHAGVLTMTAAGATSIFGGEAVEGGYVVGSTAAIAFAPAFLTNEFVVHREPTASTLYSKTGTSWAYPRSMHYIDSEHTAVVFMRESGATVDTSLAALVRMFNTATEPWTLLWTDSLPAQDSVMAYDPEYQIVYSCGKTPTTATMHASKLKQSPVSVSIVTLISGTTLQELQKTGMSVLVTDEFQSGISSVLVHWSLSAQAVSGALISAYSYTNGSGVASITYVGPRIAANFTETVSVTVATIDPVRL